jgi:short subunit dehydrogenase-like uncharacterized protein
VVASSPYLIYGANGYTGRLIARYAMERGHRPILAGRNARAVEALASELGLQARLFDLGDPVTLDRSLADVRAVLHCAGPFADTSRPMVDACLRNRVTYLDITGEVSVFEACAARDAEARDAGVMLMPGVGFDVVPSDCLAAHLKQRLPTATELSLAISGLAQASQGTAATMIESVHRGGLVRRGGILTPVALGHRSRVINFGRGPETAVAIPWGDVSTAYRSTGIPDITVYMAMPAAIRAGIAFAGMMAPLLASPIVQRVLKAGVRAGPAGPTDAERSRGVSYLWGEVADAAGGRAVSRLRTPEGYTLTALAALEITARVLGGVAPFGYHTPASAYGPDLILAIPGCERQDDPIGTCGSPATRAGW